MNHCSINTLFPIVTHCTVAIMTMNPELCEDLLESPFTENGGFTYLQSLFKKWGDLSETTEELKKQLQLAGPLVLVSFLKYSLQMISLMFIGHLGELPLSGASLATSFAQVTGFSFMDGMGGALETFCGQAYGAKQHRMVGIHMQRAVVVLMTMGIPISLVWAFAGEIFAFCKQDSEISANAGTYARWLIPSIFPYGILQCQVTFLQTQSILKPLAISTGLTSLIHGFLCWALIFKFGLGNKGAALCNTISYWIIVMILALYIRFSPSCKMTWTGFSREGGKNLLGFLSLGIPSAIMLCLVRWAYECLVLVAGLLPDPELETSMMSISMCTSAVVFMIPYGLGCAVSTRVSNELGQGRAKGAEVAARIGVYVAVVEGLVQCMVCIVARDIWGYLFSSDVVIVRYLASIMPVLAFSNFIDGFQAVLSGNARGCGWQKIGAIVNLGAYYLVGVPFALILAFVLNLGGKGLWIGIMGGSSIQVLLLLVITMRTNWDEQAKKAKNRICTTNISTHVSHRQVKV